MGKSAKAKMTPSFGLSSMTSRIRRKRLAANSLVSFSCWLWRGTKGAGIQICFVQGVLVLVHACTVVGHTVVLLWLVCLRLLVLHDASIFLSYLMTFTMIFISNPFLGRLGIFERRLLEQPHGSGVFGQVTPEDPDANPYRSKAGLVDVVFFKKPFFGNLQMQL